MMKRRLLVLALVLVLAACQKGLLDTKPDRSLLIPTTLADRQDLLDNIAVFNISPALTGIADGDFYTSEAGWRAWATDAERNSYTWAADIFGTGISYDWQLAYRQVFYANVALDGLEALAGQPGYNTVKGTALFSRAFANYNLLQEFSLPYRAGSAAADPGIVIRLTADVSVRPDRSSVEAGYQQVIADLQAARPLLPSSAAASSRPVTAAAFALLSRVYLVLGDYTHAGLYADSCLQLRSGLIDYNTLSTTATRPFPRAVPTGHAEMIYYASASSYSYASSAATLADTLLYRSYAPNDLRKQIFFKASGSSGTFKGNYAGIIALFSGIAVDEMYLNRAEAAARQGQTAAALNDLNTLLVKRWKTGTYVPLTAAGPDEALVLVLTERRKELIGRNLRWADLRRLGGPALTRPLGGQTYTLAPGSPRYAYPIPVEETGLVPNER